MDSSKYERFVLGNAKIGVDNLTYSIIGLAGEAGEVAEWFKKSVLRGNSKYTDADLLFELGDVLHYVTRIALHKGWSLADVMAGNMEKLFERDRLKAGKG